MAKCKKTTIAGPNDPIYSGGILFHWKPSGSKSSESPKSSRPEEGGQSPSPDASKRPRGPETDSEETKPSDE